MSKIFKIIGAFIDGFVDAFIDERAPRQTLRKTYTAATYPPQNYIESAIQALANDARSCDFDSTRKNYSDKIFEIVRSCWNDISGTTKSYAIAQLRTISKDADFDSTRTYISNLITKIATGKIN